MHETLEAVYFTSQSERIGDFLEEFKNVALVTSVPTTLDEFKFQFHTSRSRDPSHRSLPPFTRLKNLLIEFSWNNHCSSRVNDDIAMDLAREIPKLEILRLGGASCGTRGGVTVKGFIAPACDCGRLSRLCIHFQAVSWSPQYRIHRKEVGGCYGNRQASRHLRTIHKAYPAVPLALLSNVLSPGDALDIGDPQE